LILIEELRRAIARRAGRAEIVARLLEIVEREDHVGHASITVWRCCQSDRCAVGLSALRRLESVPRTEAAEQWLRDADAADVT